MTPHTLITSLTLITTCGPLIAADPPPAPLDPAAIAAEPMRYLENDRLKLGIHLGAGGAVTYLEDKQRKSGNMVNSFDWGRQIQLSFYSGPKPYIGPNGETPDPITRQPASIQKTGYRNPASGSPHPRICSPGRTRVSSG